MNNIQVWHNPRCTKSREVIKILEDSEYNFDTIKYLDKTLTTQEMTDTLKALNISARELMRTTESIYKDLNLKSENDETKLIEALVQYPKLIQRPIVFQNKKAIIGRPSSLVLEWLA